MAKFRNPETGGVGDIDPQHATQAIADGMVPLEDLEMYNPETKGTGVVPAAAAPNAVRDGLMAVGSREHQVATTGKLESLARGALQGGSLGFADEIQAGARSLFGDKSYQQYRDEYRGDDAIAKEANPLTFGGGEMAGGLGTALIPGLGLAKGAGLAGEAALGAKLGGIAGIGSSNADLTQGDVASTLESGVTGAIGGGIGGAAIGGLTRGISAAGSTLAKGVGSAFGPEQRLLAMGARTKDLLPKNQGRNLAAADLMEKAGVFGKNADGSRRNQEEIYQAITQRKQDAAEGMHALFEAMPRKVDSYDVTRGVQPELEEIIARAPPGEGARVIEALQNKAGDGALDKIHAADNIADLWRLKQDFGSPNYVGNAWSLPPNRTASEVQAYKVLNKHLEEVLHNETEAAAANIPGAAANQLRNLNAQYGAAATLEKMLEPAIAANKWQASSLGLRFRDVVGGNMVGAAASAAGAGPLAAVAGAAGSIANAAYRSPAARVARAQMGESLHIQELQQGQLSGMIPRQLDPFRAWLKQNMARLSQTMPQLQSQMTEVLAAPRPTAENKIRMMLPLMQNFMTPSQYPSEFNGKVSTPEDRMSAQKRLQSFGLKPHELAVRLSMLNRDGTLPPEAYAPEENQSEETDYANVLNKQGY